MIPYGRQRVSDEDIDAVVEVLRSDFLTQGPAVELFERSVASHCHVEHAVAVCNGTAALHVACMALDISAGDIVLVAATSFIASANCARFCGAQVDFVDVDPDSGLLCLQSLAEQLERYEQTGRCPKALVVVHLAGQSCDMAQVHALCNPKGIFIIEDACHALGGSYRGEPVGSCRYSDVAVFSFHPVKPVTTGEGGMLVTNNSELAKQARMLACHGINRNCDEHHRHDVGSWYYEQQQLGYNYRLSDIHAALGISQLRRLEQSVAIRQQQADNYRQLFDGTSVKPLQRQQHVQSAWHLYVVQLVDESVRNKVFNHLRKAGYGVNLHYLPIPGHPYYMSLGFDPANYPGAGRYAQISLSLPLFIGLTQDVMAAVADICLKDSCL